VAVNGESGNSASGYEGPPDGATEARANEPRSERNWLPLIIATAVVVVVVVVALLMPGRTRPAGTPINAKADPYAENLPLTNVVLSESSNMAGGKFTYVDGHIANRGDKTVTGIAVQVLFRNMAHEVAQNETIPLTLIRMRDPYVDIEPVSMAPLTPGKEQDFRLIFDNVSEDWNRAAPEIRVIKVQTK